jgi:hypothetical protein
MMRPFLQNPLVGWLDEKVHGASRANPGRFRFRLSWVGDSSWPPDLPMSFSVIWLGVGYSKIARYSRQTIFLVISRFSLYQGYIYLACNSLSFDWTNFEYLMGDEWIWDSYSELHKCTRLIQTVICKHALADARLTYDLVSSSILALALVHDQWHRAPILIVLYIGRRENMSPTENNGSLKKQLPFKVLQESA